jgi:hypothetical protein
MPKKNGTVRSISDHRKLNAELKNKPYTIPQISQMLQESECVAFATSLYLNMGYYNIKLYSDSWKLCTIVTGLGKYQYIRLPMGITYDWDMQNTPPSDLANSR